MSIIKFKKLTEDAIEPKRATEQSVGYDLFAPMDISIESNTSIVVNIGIACEFSSSLWLGIYGRSSFATKGLVNPLGVGVVDADYYYTGESIKVALWNTTGKTIYIPRGEAIAQAIFHNALIGDDVVTTKREGGFGSTDKKRNTIEFQGIEKEYRRATFEFRGKNFKGIFIEENFDSFYACGVFISDEPFEWFNSGDDDRYKDRCWFVDYSKKGLTLL